MNRILSPAAVALVFVLGAAICAAPSVHASKTKSGSTAARVGLTDHYRKELERDISRPILAEEWPAIMFASPPGVDGWRGPYATTRQLSDGWGRSLVFRETAGVYSLGADGIDDRGEKDDITSSRSPDSRYYPRPPIRLDDLPSILIPPLILTLLIGIPASWLWQRRKPGIATR